MREQTAAEKFLGNWASDYAEADPQTRLGLETSVERCLADAEFVGLSRRQVMKAANGDVAAYLTRALEDRGKEGKQITGKRELIEPRRGDKRYLRRDKKGEFKEEKDVGRSLAADRRQHAKTVVKPGQGDRGDQGRR